MMRAEVEGDIRGIGEVVLIGPEGLIEIHVVSVQSRADVNSMTAVRLSGESYLTGYCPC